jgi:hypothetical protein
MPSRINGDWGMGESGLESYVLRGTSKTLLPLLIEERAWQIKNRVYLCEHKMKESVGY